MKMVFPSPVIAGAALQGAIGRISRWYALRQSNRGLNIHTRLDRTLRALARLYARYELPQCVRLLEAVLIQRQELWTTSGVRECRGCWHGYRLRLDLSDFYQRWAFFLSRYHEVPLQILLWRALRPGDIVIDGGANNGLVSLVAAWRVGRRGSVLAFEPNPTVFDQLAWHARANSLAQIEPRREGLSDADDDEIAFRVPGLDNLGAGTFCPPPARYGGVTRDAVLARTIRADNLTLPRSGALTVKLDVEGFELRALRGMDRLLAERKPLVITEINREMLVAAGESPYALFKHMHARGYRGYGFRTARAIVRQRRIVLWRVPSTGPRMPHDIAWIHPQSEAWRRLACFIPDLTSGEPSGEARPEVVVRTGAHRVP